MSSVLGSIELQQFSQLVCSSHFSLSTVVFIAHRSPATLLRLDIGLKERRDVQFSLPQVPAVDAHLLCRLRSSRSPAFQSQSAQHLAFMAEWEQDDEEWVPSDEDIEALDEEDYLRGAMTGEDCCCHQHAAARCSTRLPAHHAASPKPPPS